MRGRWKRLVLAVLGLGTCLWMPDVEAGAASNVFVTVEADSTVENAGEGFAVETSGEVRITPRRDWRLVSPPGGKAFVSPGRPVVWKVASVLGEDTKTGGVHRCSFPVTTNIIHVSAPGLAASSAPVAPFVYASPSAGADVTVGFAARQVTNGMHLVETKWERCECGKAHDPLSETVVKPVNFGLYEWTTPSGPQSGQSCQVALPDKAKGMHMVSATVTASAGECEECRLSCTATNGFTVSELSVSCPAWLGLNRTDDGPDRTGISATATLDPELEDAECAWGYSGVCEPAVEPTNSYQYNLTVTNRDVASEGYLTEEVKATVLGCTAVTNFTVVKVDVAIDGSMEEEEEKVGAFVRHVADVDGGELWTREGTNALVAVSVACEPRDLPEEAAIKVLGPAGYLFERKGGGYVKVEDAVEYPASEIAGKRFYLHGHEASGELRDHEVSANHGTSGAVDKTKFTVAKVNLTATGLDGVVSEEKEETAGVFIHWNIDNDNDSDNTLGYPKHPGGDFLQTNETVAAENELQPLRLEVLPKSAAGLMTLKSTGISLWRFRRKGRGARILGAGETLKLDLTTKEGLERLEIIEGSLYAEGVAKGAGSVEIKVGFCGQDISDRVSYRIVAADCGNQPQNDEKASITKSFPGLKDCEWSITGPCDNKYNCLAWSVGRTNVWVNPAVIIEGESIAQAVNEGVTFLGIDGKYGNKNGQLEKNELDEFYLREANAVPVRKLEEADILYYDAYHAARRMRCACGEGRWEVFESKCGGSYRLEHVYDQLESFYGDAIKGYKVLNQ